MTPEEFEKWYESVDGEALRDAAYTGLVDGPAEIGRLVAAYKSSQATVYKYWEQRESDRMLIAVEKSEIKRLKSTPIYFPAFGMTYKEAFEAADEKVRLQGLEIERLKSQLEDKDREIAHLEKRILLYE